MNPSLLKTSFGRVAKDYQKYRRSYDPKLYDLLFSLLPKNKKLTILDIGCGTGKSTEPLLTHSKQQIEVVGIDPDKAMLHEARLSAKKKKLSIVYTEGTAEKLPFETEMFDAVIAGTAFHWFANKKAFKEIRRVLKKNGLFFVFRPQFIRSNKPAIGDAVYEKYNCKGISQKLRSQKHTGKLFTQAGFKGVTTTVIPFTEKRTIDQEVGCQKTNSHYIVLSAKDKKGFVREMTVAYKAFLGKQKYITNKLELRICCGFK